jgi:hypothetical protein
MEGSVEGGTYTLDGVARACLLNGEGAGDQFSNSGQNYLPQPLCLPILDNRMLGQGVGLEE